MAGESQLYPPPIDGECCHIGFSLCVLVPISVLWSGGGFRTDGVGQFWSWLWSISYFIKNKVPL